jgi:hypothetical protein
LSAGLQAAVLVRASISTCRSQNQPCKSLSAGAAHIPTSTRG